MNITFLDKSDYIKKGLINQVYSRGVEVLTLKEFLMKGQSREDILQYASKEWNVSDRTADEYIANAWTKIDRLLNRKYESRFCKELQFSGSYL